MYFFKELNFKYILLLFIQSRIKTKENNCGPVDAAADLLDYLCRKQDWFPKLIEVLRIKELKVNHLADMFEKIKGNVKILSTNTLTYNDQTFAIVFRLYI